MASTRNRERILGILVSSLLGVLLIALPAFLVITRPSKQKQYVGSSIAHHLRIIEGAKEQWALEQKRDAGSVPTTTDLAPYFRNGVLPGSVDGETYRINPVGTPASAKLLRNLGAHRAGAVITNY